MSFFLKCFDTQWVILLTAGDSLTWWKQHLSERRQQKNTKKKININHIKEKTSRHIGRRYELRPSRKKASTVEVWTLPPPYDSWQRLQLTPVTTSSGSSGCWKWMDWWYEFVSCAPLWWVHVRALAEPLQPETDVGAFKINMRNWAVVFGIVIESITWCFDYVGVWYRRH